MTIQDTAEVFQILQGAYPNWRPSKDTLVTWAALFADQPMEKVIAGVKAFIATDTKGFAPGIGQINEIIHRPAACMTETEAWALVKRAISNSLYGCYEEFDKLPSLLQKVVGDPMQLRDWALLTEGLDTVVASNFQRSYRVELERQRVDAALPMDVKKVLGIGGIVLASNAPWAPIPEIGSNAQLSGSSLRPLGKGCEAYEKKN